ncbi:MAG: hybrid sensor histidine kinase/response regulator [Burkholderiaceae bacterium]
MTPSDPAQRARIDREIFSLSVDLRTGSVILQVTICLIATVFFGYPDHGLSAALWAALVLGSLSMRVLLPMTAPGDDPEQIAQRLRTHQRRVLLSALAWGSAGVLLFDRQDQASQLALTVFIVSTSIGFSFSASSHGPTLKRALPLLVGPVVVSLLLSPQPTMWVMALMGSSFLVLMHRLVSERSRQLEETLLLRLLAQEAREEKQRFFAAASHDLRQPLQALNLYQGLLAQGDTSPGVVQRMGECIEALDRLLTGVLDISRLDAGKITPHIEAVHLPGLMMRLATLHEPAVRAKGLRWRLHPQEVWVHSDPALLERILSNLLGNACRYTEAGTVLFAARLRGTQVLLQVIDTGIGVPAESQKAIFAEFTQLQNPQRDPRLGTGLGLATAKRLAHLLGLRIALRSTPGKGSCFEIAVPLCTSPAHNATHSDTPPDHRSDNLVSVLAQTRVLVVEDNGMVRDALVSLLGSWGMLATTVGNARQAIEQLDASRFDVVLSDWRLPGELDGLAVLQKAQTQPHVRLAALLTGDKTTHPPTTFPVVSKPVRPLRLRALLLSHLTNEQASDPPPAP